MLNGNIAPSITPQRDPLSTLLFLMTIKPLRNLLCHHEEQGIWINGTTVATGLMFCERLDIAYRKTKWLFDVARTRSTLLDLVRSSV